MTLALLPLSMLPLSLRSAKSAVAMDGAGRVEGELKGVGAVSEAATDAGREGIAVLT